MLIIVIKTILSGNVAIKLTFSVSKHEFYW